MMEDRVTVQEAARRLGVKDDAIRKRIQRGSLQHDKGLDGRVYVYLDGGGHANGERQRGGADAMSQDALLASLREQVGFLRSEIERKDAIIMALASRIPELETRREPQGGPESAAEAPERGRTNGSEKRPLDSPWWRRVLGE